MSDRYGACTAVDDIKVKSALTLGEDITERSWAARSWPTKRVVKDLKLEHRDGLAPDQRFCIGFAQWVCDNARLEQQREWALTNPHSLSRYRINGGGVDMPGFANAFPCKPGAPMTKPAGKACSTW